MFDTDRSNQFVSHTEFAEFRDSTGEAFNRIFNELTGMRKDTAAALEAVRQDTKTDPKTILGIVSILLIVAGLSASLVMVQINNSYKATEAGDTHNREVIRLRHDLYEAWDSRQSYQISDLEERMLYIEQTCVKPSDLNRAIP